MPEIIYCPRCNAALQLPSLEVGQQLACPRCGRDFTLGSDHVQAEEPRYQPGKVERPSADEDESREDEGHEDVDVRAKRRRDLQGVDVGRMAWIFAAISAGGEAINLVLIWLGRAAENAQAPLPQDAADALQYATFVAGIAGGLVQIVAMVLFLTWLYYSIKNLANLDATGRTFSPGWAVLTYFIPILNLFKPYLSMVELWKASDPRLVDATQDWQRARNNSAILLWWVLHLASSITGFVALQIALRTDAPLEESQIGDNLTLLSSVLAVPTTLLQMYLIRAITDRQFARLERLDELDEAEGRLPAEGE